MRLPDDLIAVVDERARNLGLSRTQWFENLLRWTFANTEAIKDRDERAARNAKVAPSATLDTPGAVGLGK